MTKIVPIDSRVHKNTKIKTDPKLAFCRNQHIVPIVIHEIVAAAHEFPLMFIKDKEADKYRLCGVLGLKTEQNLFCDENGWKGSYIPAAFRAYPFAMMQHPEDENQRILCVDEDSDWVNEEEGVAIFDEEGKRTEHIEKLGGFILDLQQRQQMTEKLTDLLVEHNLLEEKTLEIGAPDSKKYAIAGIYVINEQKFNELSDEDFLKFRQGGFVGAIYGILMSMSRVNNLLKLAAEAGEELPAAQTAQ